MFSAYITKSHSQQETSIPTAIKLFMLIAVIFNRAVSASSANDACTNFAIANKACNIMAAIPPKMFNGGLFSTCANKQMYFNKMSPAEQLACLEGTISNPTYDLPVPRRRK